jgi:hypothetical protein
MRAEMRYALVPSVFMCLLAFGRGAFAQEATILGKITDTSGADVSGVAIHAVHAASGNSFDAVTDEHSIASRCASDPIVCRPT